MIGLEMSPSRSANYTANVRLVYSVFLRQLCLAYTASTEAAE